MNEGLRLLRHLLRRHGYDLRRRKDFDVRHLAHAGALADPRAIEALEGYLGAPGEAAAEARLDRLRLHLRTCIRGNPDRPSGRLTGVSVQENVLRCVASTVAAVNQAARDRGAGAVEVVVFDDHSEDSALERLKSVLGALSCPWALRTTRQRGQGLSLHESLAAARGANALLYACEDDYLHAPSAVLEMWDFYATVCARTGRHMVLHPTDYPDRYKDLYPSYVLLGAARHWRTISHVTHTFFTHGRVLDEHWRCFENTRYAGRDSRGSEKNTTNLLFDFIPGFSPLPALACHLQSAVTLPPYFEWRALWDRYAAAARGPAARAEAAGPEALG